MFVRHVEASVTEAGVYLAQPFTPSLCVQFTIFVWRFLNWQLSELAELPQVMMQSK
jgi:hypothetical protein